MYIPLRIGETTTIMDPATGEPITVRVDAIENGKRGSPWLRRQARR